ncbi:hypothetical protein EJ05DRAFT_542027 [Pseudovirgaria hyperparasitica]|uniref:WKF domain-containing protein n=1 Tax=Pseudovirgaria hyperparasitica TaxID=470096 RepID=A0A6A6VUZ6_9PEZI|nr:uncharacterized protein EJ05DRAFT_542027 [Pseudovirgaria hyperparasitica]KAF2753544.1 hypothetical protein EJ05DRAFT_542027 [Pseudovirgaria hyperparasitica]
MALNSTTAISVAAHVPAWKRLGLRLKCQSDGTGEARTCPLATSIPLDIGIQSASTSEEVLRPKPQQSTEKRKRDGDISTGESSTKKKRHSDPRELRKTERIKDLAREKTNTPLTISTEAHDNEDLKFNTSVKTKRSSLSSSIRHQVSKAADARSSSPRKTVSFSADTKTDDGSSAQDLFRTWSDSQQQGEYGLTPEEIAEYLEPGSLPAKAKSDSPEVVQDRIKQKKIKKASRHLEKSSIESEPFLKYLHTYATDRRNWKFNKTHQTTLLKHAFNIFRIPDDMEADILAYLAGLQGDAAKSRLRGTAQEIIASSAAIQDAGTMSESVVRDSAHDNALAERLIHEKKRRRAEKILFTIGPEPTNPSSGSALPIQKHNSASTAVPKGTLLKFDDEPLPPVQPRSRRKKRRTDVSSSSESSSDTSSDSDGSDVSMPSRIGDAPKRTPAIAKPRVPVSSPLVPGEAASALSSSDSSSDSDTDSESDDEGHAAKKSKSQSHISEDIRMQLFGSAPFVNEGMKATSTNRFSSPGAASTSGEDSGEEHSSDSGSDSEDSHVSEDDLSSDESSESE